MSTGKARLLLFTVIALRATSLLFCTIAMRTLGPVTLNGIRFLLTFALLLVIFRKELPKIRRGTLVGGAVIGIFFFLTMLFEMIGLQMTNTSTTSFLENTAIIFVPFVQAALTRKHPGLSAVVSGILALTGVGFLTMKGGHLGFSAGELCCLATALFYTATIIATGHYSRKEEPILLGILQVGVIGILSMICAFIVEEPVLPASATEWGSLLFLVVICTGFGFTLQPVAQSRVSTETAGLFCAFNPLITTLLGFIFLHEQFTRSSLTGAALILASIVASALMDHPRRAGMKRSEAATP
ncbi:MAG: DMT family transporter [Mogibacterium sp.]|nr:DMT family transporter [Mogibacterium sp.]